MVLACFSEAKSNFWIWLFVQNWVKTEPKEKLTIFSNSNSISNRQKQCFFHRLSCNNFFSLLKSSYKNGWLCAIYNLFALAFHAWKPWFYSIESLLRYPILLANSCITSLKITWSMFCPSKYMRNQSPTIDFSIMTSIHSVRIRLKITTILKLNFDCILTIF